LLETPINPGDMSFEKTKKKRGDDEKKNLRWRWMPHPQVALREGPSLERKQSESFQGRKKKGLSEGVFKIWGEKSRGYRENLSHEFHKEIPSSGVPREPPGWGERSDKEGGLGRVVVGKGNKIGRSVPSRKSSSIGGKKTHGRLGRGGVEKRKTSPLQAGHAEHLISGVTGLYRKRGSRRTVGR